MSPSSPSSRRVSVVPQQSPDAETRSSYLDWLPEGSGETDVRTRLVDDESLDKADDGTGYSKADAVVMKEVAAWLKMRKHDEFWASRSSHSGKILPTASELLARLKEPDTSLPNTLDHAERFNALIQAIALQLLASCYTFLPIPSANHIPLFQQKTGSKLVTALQAHSPYRFSPAAGHHARASSETTAWPDQYFGSPPEDTNQLRRSAKRSGEYTPHFAASGWVDGLNDAEHSRSGSRLRRRSSPCGVDFLTRLCYRPSSPTNSPQRHSSVFMRNLCIGDRDGQSSDNQDPSGKNRVLPADSRTLQHLSSVERHHDTQSRPSIRREERPVFNSSPRLDRRTSSQSSISSTLKQTFAIPEIRRMSATPNAVHKVESCTTAHPDSSHKPQDEVQITQPPTFSHLNKLPPVLSQTADIAPFSDPEEQRKTEGYFNMRNASTSQPSGTNQDQDLVFSNPLPSAVHNSTQPDHTSETNNIQDDVHDNPTIYPPPATRIHPRLARDNSGMYDDDTGPDPASDPRLRKLMARQESSESGSEGESEMERDQRRGSIEGVEEEVVERVGVLAREIGGGEGSTGIGKGSKRKG